MAAAEHLRRLHVTVGRLALVLRRSGADMRAVAAVERLQVQIQRAAPALAQARETAVRRVHMQKATRPAPGFNIPPSGGGFTRR